jgi:cell division septum initiation protein DivIVA
MEAEELIKQAGESMRSALDAAQRRADEIVREAEAEAQRIRGEAEAEARKRLEQVRDALDQLEAGFGGRAAQPEAAPTPRRTEPTPQGAPAPDPGAPPAADETEPEPPPAAQKAHDEGGAARLVAMKLALDGTSRDEAREQLAAEYEVDDLDSLLDEVYSKAGR